MPVIYRVMSPTLELTLVEIWAWQWGQVIATGAEPNAGSGGDNCCCCITTGDAATPPAAGDVSITVEVVGFTSENNNTLMNCQSRVEHQHSYLYTKISKNTDSKYKACCRTAACLNMNFTISTEKFWFGLAEAKPPNRTKPCRSILMVTN